MKCLNKGIQQICEILRSPKFPQGRGDLMMYHIKPEYLDEDGGLIGDTLTSDMIEVETKCALGEISCRTSNLAETWRRMRKLDSTTYSEEILSAVKGLPRDLIVGRNLPLTTKEGPEFDSEFKSGSLGHIIYGLNDEGFTYAEICEFLETTFGDVEDEV